MSMSDWARREVEIACKREAPDRKDGEWDYGCGCYESALKAYLSLMDDGHSGMSFSLTAAILKRLLEGKPLTPIEDVPEVWNESRGWADGGKHYQCNRMTSLFKDVSADGTVTYNDVGRYYCKEVDSGATYTCGLESRLLDELHPITMPYNPPLGYYVFTVMELLTDRKNGDFDTKGIMTLKCPDGTVEQINRYYAVDGNGWREISLEEWCDRVNADRARVQEEQNERERTGKAD